jgi:glycosyl hydrolase family 18 (putative chitinase)
MHRSRPIRHVVAAIAVAAAAALVPSVSASAERGDPLPAHVFAPYFETYTADSPAMLSRVSGARFLTLAFLETPSAGSCRVYWNGDKTAPVAWSTYGADIARIRAAGGDVIPSFGGFSADNGGTELADSCASVNAIAAEYERVITTYGVTRLDMDVEDNSLTNNAGIDRRNKAIQRVEAWAARHERTIEFVYTLPTNTSGLDSTGVHVLRNAAANNARVDIVNIMTFDYYDEQPHQMAADTKTAAGHLINTLQNLYPRRSVERLWSMVGITEMVGIDDFGPPEIFTTNDAVIVESWAEKHGIAELSFWALERDNGGCPGAAGSDGCSGVHQSTWQFSHTFEPFTSVE